MKKWFLPIAAIFCAGLAQAEAQDQAKPGDGEVVAATGMECSNYFAVKIGDEYALLEWYGGYQPQKDDKVSGAFDHFGYQDIVVQPGGARLRAYVADYGLSLDDANSKLQEKCN